MKVKVYFFAISLCCMLPFMVQGADLLENGKPDPPRAPLRSVPSSPVMVETGSGMLTLYFRSDLGEVCILLQEETGKVAYQQSVDTSIQSQAFIAVPSGTYILSVTDIAGDVIKQESIDIP